MKPLLIFTILFAASAWGQRHFAADTAKVSYSQMELDTIYLSESYYGKSNQWMFIVDKKNYSKAAYACQLSIIPYQGLNDAAKQRLAEGQQYILSQEIVKPKRKKSK